MVNKYCAQSFARNWQLPFLIQRERMTVENISWSISTKECYQPWPETDNCPSWISGRERMTIENISWSISTKEFYQPWRGLNPRPGLQSDGASNRATEAIKFVSIWTICKELKAVVSQAHTLSTYIKKKFTLNAVEDICYMLIVVAQLQFCTHNCRPKKLR